ncbi:hypothetical protein F2Q70_00017403 [Brassica cretica]|uniref:Retrotransposon gag domain-containing protein n=1 Tax=Brassica cretica TaxID=69181 RepID=A0A8S9I676_BRACR|nr:hypothetical protein F2Q70_00017403 [Brassica cretica]
MSVLEISDDFGAFWRYLEQAPEMTIELDHRSILERNNRSYSYLCIDRQRSAQKARLVTADLKPKSSPFYKITPDEFYPNYISFAAMLEADTSIDAYTIASIDACTVVSIDKLQAAVIDSANKPSNNTIHRGTIHPGTVHHTTIHPGAVFRTTVYRTTVYRTTVHRDTVHLPSIDTVHLPSVDTIHPVSVDTVHLASNDTVHRDTVHPNTVHPNTVHPNTVHPNTVHPDTVHPLINAHDVVIPDVVAVAEMNDFDLTREWYDMVGQDPFQGLPHQDPRKHIKELDDLVSRSEQNEVSEYHMLCKIFFYSISGDAFRWFSQLQQGSLISWDDNERAFLYKFLDDDETTQEKEKNDRWDRLLASLDDEYMIPAKLFDDFLAKRDEQHMSGELSRVEEAGTEDATSTSTYITNSTSIYGTTSKSVAHTIPASIDGDFCFYKTAQTRQMFIYGWIP